MSIDGENDRLPEAKDPIVIDGDGRLLYRPTQSGFGDIPEIKTGWRTELRGILLAFFFLSASILMIFGSFFLVGLALLILILFSVVKFVLKSLR